MNNRYIPLPDGRKLIEGSIVVFETYPDIKWVTHYGWYMYNLHQYNGWHFVKVDDGTILPLDNTLITSIVWISESGCDCPPHPPHPPCPPCPPHPPMPPLDDNAFITVDTIPERDALNSQLVPHGKVVKVNYTPEGVTKYYSWDQVNSKWVDETFGIDTSTFVDMTYLDGKLAPISERVTNVETQLSEIDLKNTWKQL